VSASIRAAIFFTASIVAQAAHADRQVEDAQLNAVYGVEYETSKMIALEPGVIAASHGRARRDGADLVLKIAHAQPVTLTGDHSGCEPPKFDTGKCFSFTLVADLPSRHAYIVADSYYESGNAELIDDRTGTRTMFAKIPRLSPAGDLLLVFSNSEAEDDGGLIQLWKRQGGRVAKEWEISQAEAKRVGYYETALIGWLHDGVQLDLTNPEMNGKPETHHPATLARSKSGWQLIFENSK
jgi:hypothetical protein